MEQIGFSLHMMMFCLCFFLIYILLFMFLANEYLFNYFIIQDSPNLLNFLCILFSLYFQGKVHFKGMVLRVC